jgi:predicted nucleic acid-binding protein
MAKAKLYCWDSSVFIKLFNDEPGADDVQHFLDEAENEEVVIIVSSIVPVEVLKLKGQKPIAQKDQNKIREFFQKDYFRWVDLSKKVGEIAQDLIWNHNLWPKDAIHLASAIEFETLSKLKLDAIHSYDDDFLKLNGKLPIKAAVTKPVPSQGVMRKLLAAAKAEKKAKALPAPAIEIPPRRIEPEL